MASLASLSDFGKKYTQLCSHPNYDDIHPEWRQCIDRITMDGNITYAFKVFIYETLFPPRFQKLPNRLKDCNYISFRTGVSKKICYK